MQLRPYILGLIRRNFNQTKGLRNMNFIQALYYYDQFGRGWDMGQAGRNLDVGHLEGGQGTYLDFGQSKGSATCSMLLCGYEYQVSTPCDLSMAKTDLKSISLRPFPHIKRKLLWSKAVMVCNKGVLWPLFLTLGPLATQRRVGFHLSYSFRNVLQERFLVKWARLT